MKKLLYITTGVQESGGVQRMLSVKFNYLINNYGYEIVVANSNYKEGSFFYNFHQKVKFYHINPGNFFFYKKEVLDVIEKENPDLIVNADNGLKGSIIACFLDRNIPLIYERHCSRNISSSNIFEFVKLKISNILLDIKVNGYRSFVVLNENEKNIWNYPNTVVIPNPLWFEASQEDNNLEKKYAIAVGRHSKEKRYDKLIRVWKDVIKIHPDWVLKIYGRKDDKLKLETLVTELKLDDKIKFLDPVLDVEEIYSESSLLLMTSESEAFGLVLIEAMAFGIPVVAFNGTSGTNMLIKDNFNGFLVNKNDNKTYVDKVAFLMKNIEFRKEIGKNAKCFTKKFEMKSIMKQWDDLFQSSVL